MFQGVHFNHDSQNSFPVHHDSRTPKMVGHGVTKIPLPPSSYLYARYMPQKTTCIRAALEQMLAGKPCLNIWRKLLLSIKRSQNSKPF